MSTGMEELLARHRKELRDLTSRTTQKKKAATKKTRKGVNSECETLERETKERHQREIEELGNPNLTNKDPKEEEEEGEDDEEEQEERGDDDGKQETNDTYSKVSTSNSTDPAESVANPNPPSPAQRSKKPNRQRARLARRAAEIAAVSEAAALEAESLPNLREQELSAMKTQLSSLNLEEHPIAPDGHCLYSAFADQLIFNSIPLSSSSSSSPHPPPEPAQRDLYKLTRRKCAHFMRENKDDFAPFLEDDFDTHVDRVENTAEWGGQAEVLALAKAYGVAVNVVQAQGRGVEKMNEGVGEKVVWLGYYRHSFGLGEHYNSLRRKG